MILLHMQVVCGHALLSERDWQVPRAQIASFVDLHTERTSGHPDMQLPFRP